MPNVHVKFVAFLKSQVFYLDTLAFLQIFIR